MTRKIIEILDKYKQENWSQNVIINFDNDIQNTINNLKEIQNNLSHKLLEINLSDQENDDNICINILNDIKEIKHLIVHFNQIKNDIFDMINEKNIKNNYQENDKFIFDEIINIFVISDNLCPECNTKLDFICINFQKIIDKNMIQHEIINGCKCPCCNRLFVLECDIENTNLANTNIVLNYQYLENKQLTFCDIIVLSNIVSCTVKAHNLSDMTVEVPIFNKDGSIEYIKINVSYCKQCNKYIMLKNDFKMIEGVVACQVIDETSTRKKNNSNDEIEIKQYESILYQYGYNVKTKENISDKQRHLILASIVECNILTREQICSHLDTLIERGHKIDKWKLATQKWQQDRHYIKKYNTSNLPDILLNKVILKYSEYR